MTKEDFLKGVSSWDNHRYLLWEALRNTSGRVVEFGSGKGSTPFLRKYCEDEQREFLSYDNDSKYAEENKSTFVPDWAQIGFDEISVLLIDHAPGERRWLDIQKYAMLAEVIVIHDSQPHEGYKLNQIWGLFPYRIDNKFQGTWATLVSNFIDKEKFES